MQAAPLATSALTSPAKLLSEIFGKNEINNGFITIVRKKGEVVRHVSSFETTREEEVDRLIQHRGADYYFSKAQMIRPGKWREENVFAFNAIYLDLDAHDRQIDLERLETLITGLIEEDGTIPSPSIVVRSGRGLQLIWPFDQRPACFLPSVKMITQYYADVVSELLDMCGDPDFRGLVDWGNCANVAGVTRLPGGTNTKNGARATFHVLSQRHIDFDSALDSANARLKLTPVRKMCGLSALGERRMRAIERASIDNCGPNNSEGYRDLTLFHYCAAARTAGYDAATAMQKCHDLNATFAKPLKDREVDSYLSTAKTGKYNRITNRRIIKDLAIDDTIQTRCGLTGTARLNHNRARDRRRKSKKEERNAKIYELHEQGMTNAAIARALGCHHETVRVVLAEILKKDNQPHRLYTSVATSIEIPEFQNLNLNPKIGELKESAHNNTIPTDAIKKQAKVQVNCHVTVDHQNYSVPYEYVGQKVEVYLTAARVDVVVGKKLIASHARLTGRKGQYSTNPAHMPKNPRVLAWNADRYIRWAQQIGHSTEASIRSLFARTEIEQQRYKSAMAILRLAHTYGAANVEWACQILDSTSAFVTTAKLKPLLELKSAKGG